MMARRMFPGWLALALALLALLGMALSDLNVTSVSFRTAESSDPPIQMAAPYFRDLVPMKTQEVTVDLHYRGYGNHVIHLTPYDCFDPHYSLNGISYAINSTANLCTQVTLDLSQGLKAGSNLLVLRVKVKDGAPSWRWSVIGLAAGTPFIGDSIVHANFSLLLLAVALAAAWRFLSRRGWDPLARLLFLLACLLYIQGLAFMPAFPASNDIAGHIDYITFVAHHSSPVGYQGYESWNPPLYYMICAAIARIAAFTGAWDCWVGIRLFSVLCQAVFLYCAVECCRLLLRGMVFYTAICLIALWPSGLIAYATWINNDIFLHALYAIGFYWLLRWHENGEPRWLGRAIMAGGLALLAKSSAMVLAAIIGICFAVKCFEKKAALGLLLRRELRLGWLTAAICLALMLLKSIYMARLAAPHAAISLSELIFGHSNPASRINPSMVLLPDLGSLMEHPFNDGYGSLWDFQLKTLLFTGSAWQHPLLGSCLHALFLLMMLYVLFFIATLSRKRIVSLLPLLVGIFIPLCFSLFFTYFTQEWPGIDFRYIRPSLIALVMLFMLAVAQAKAKGWPVVYAAGNFAGMLFAVLSLLFFEGQLS